MKRFQFGLERLLELRAFHERRAELLLAERAGACAIISRRIEANLESRARTAGDRRGMGVADFRAAEFYVRRLDIEREVLARELAAAELLREEARLAFVKRRRDREAVGKLRERREAEYYHLAAREETKELDDLARTGRLAGGMAAGTAAAGGR